jgi:uncharacterized membrane protein YphA (DoxX/SURF4 family)
MFETLSKNVLAPFILRVPLGLIFAYHGGMKIAQDFGAGWYPNFPAGAQMVVAWGECIGGLALLAGLFSRLAALGISLIMSSAILLFFSLGKPEFIPDNLALGAHGFNLWIISYEYNVAIVAMCLAVVCLGGGRLSVDYYLWHRKKAASAPQLAPRGQPVMAH